MKCHTFDRNISKFSLIGVCVCWYGKRIHLFIRSASLFDRIMKMVDSWWCRICVKCWQFIKFAFSSRDFFSSFPRRSQSSILSHSLILFRMSLSLSRPCRLSLLLSVVALSLLALVLARSSSLSLSLCVVVCFKCKKKILFIRCSVVLCKFVENFFRRSHLYNMKTHRLSFAKRYIHSFVCALLLSVSHTQITTFSVQWATADFE